MVFLGGSTIVPRAGFLVSSSFSVFFMRFIHSLLSRTLLFWLSYSAMLLPDSRLDSCVRFCMERPRACERSVRLCQVPSLIRSRK